MGMRDFFAALGSALAGFFFIRPLGFVLSLFTRSSTKVTSLIDHPVLVAQQQSNVTKIHEYFERIKPDIDKGRMVESLLFIDMAINLYHLLTICERLTILDQLNAHVIADKHLVTSIKFSLMIGDDVLLCVKVLEDRQTKLFSSQNFIYACELQSLVSKFSCFILSCFTHTAKHTAKHKLPDISKRKMQLAKYLQGIDVTKIYLKSHDSKEYTSAMIKHHQELAASLENASITEALAEAPAPCREHINKMTPYDSLVHHTAKRVRSAATTGLPRTTISNADAITVSIPSSHASHPGH